MVRGQGQVDNDARLRPISRKIQGTTAYGIDPEYAQRPEKRHTAVARLRTTEAIHEHSLQPTARATASDSTWSSHKDL